MKLSVTSYEINALWKFQVFSVHNVVLLLRFCIKLAQKRGFNWILRHSFTALVLLLSFLLNG